WRKKNVSSPNTFRNELAPLSDQLLSWLPGNTYSGRDRLSKICLAKASSSSDPNSVTSPDRITKSISRCWLRSRTVRLKSSAPVAPPTWVSVTWANLKGCWPTQYPHTLPNMQTKIVIIHLIIGCCTFVNIPRLQMPHFLYC